MEEIDLDKTPKESPSKISDTVKSPQVNDPFQIHQANDSVKYHPQVSFSDTAKVIPTDPQEPSSARELGESLDMNLKMQDKSIVHGCMHTAETRLVMEEMGNTEDLVHWWKIPESQVSLWGKRRCLCLAFPYCWPVAVVCCPCGYCLYKSTTAVYRSKLYILTETKLIAYHDAEVLCACMIDGFGAVEHSLDKISSIIVVNGKGIYQNSFVRLVVPFLTEDGREQRNASCVIFSDKPLLVARTIRDQMKKMKMLPEYLKSPRSISSSSLGLCMSPSQMKMEDLFAAAGETSKRVNPVSSLQTLRRMLESKLITETEYGEKKAEILRRI